MLLLVSSSVLYEILKDKLFTSNGYFSAMQEAS